MALVVKDRVRETSTTTGTGDITLSGAVVGYQGFSVIGDGNTTYYCIAGAIAWEVGLGTVVVAGPVTTLQRTSVLASSNGGAAVNFSSETKQVFVTYPASSFSSVDIQEFTTVGTSTWTKPLGAKFVEVLMYGGGGGGGSGRRRSASTANAAAGGGGGAASSRVEVRIPAVALNATETVIVGAGGSGGAAQTVDETNGANGVAGSLSQFKTYIASGGAFGGGGTQSSGASGIAQLSIETTRLNVTLFNPSGGTGSFVGSVGARGGLRGGGGAGGPGFDAAATQAQVGVAGGLGGAVFSNNSASTGGGGGTAGAAGGNGGNGANAPAGYWVGGSGGGSGGCTSTQAGSGGAGGYPGGGGAGGAAASGAFNSGAGGNGADGFVRVVTYL